MNKYLLREHLNSPRFPDHQGVWHQGKKSKEHGLIFRSGTNNVFTSTFQLLIILLKKEKNHGVYPVETINSQGHENDSMWLSHFLFYWDKGDRSGGLPRSLVSSSVGDVCERNNRKLGEREKKPA
jgi:hypothetical protein